LFCAAAIKMIGPRHSSIFAGSDWCKIFHSVLNVPGKYRRFRMFKRIVVAIDGSQTSRRAFEAALDLAQIHGAVLQPFYVVENTPLYFDVPGYDPSALRTQLVEQGKTLGSESIEAMRARGIEGDVAIGEATSLEDVSALVLKAARDFNADLLVMGTHGRKGFQRLILGSVAERCLRQATLPVLLIPSAAGSETPAEQS
jgi:nucleotide-binding universal stress UspA family protein